MPAPTSYDAILSALSAGMGQEVFFSKTAPAAQVAGAFHTSWAYTGIPSAGAWLGAGGSTGATLVTADSSSVGALGIVSPSTASAANPYVVAMGATPSTAVAGTLMLIDRLADTGPLSTSAGGTCTLTMPVGGWARYTDGVGVAAFVESLTGIPNASTVVGLNYTNTAATAGRVSSTATVVAGAHRVVGSSGPFIGLQGTDTGIKSIESISVTSVAALNIAVVVYKPLLMLPCVTANYYTERDMVIQTPKLPKLNVSADKTACLQWIFFAGAATTPVIVGSLSTVTN